MIAPPPLLAGPTSFRGKILHHEFPDNRGAAEMPSVVVVRLVIVRRPFPRSLKKVWWDGIYDREAGEVYEAEVMAYFTRAVFCVRTVHFMCWKTMGQGSQALKRKLHVPTAMQESFSFPTFAWEKGSSLKSVFPHVKNLLRGRSCNDALFCRKPLLCFVKTSEV